GEGQHQADADERQHRQQRDAIHRPPPGRKARPVGAVHDASLRWAEESLATSARNSSPRCSKSRNWSKDAQAGDSRTTEAVVVRAASAEADAIASASVPEIS